MIFETNIYKALSPMIEPKFKLFFADKGYPEPKPPYCMVSFIDSRNIGMPSKTVNVLPTYEEKLQWDNNDYVTDDNGNYIFTDRKFFNLIESISQVKEVNISLTFQYNPRDETFQEYVEDFHTGLGFSNSEWLFGSNNIGLVSYQDILYMFTPINNTTSYRRATIDLLLRIERTVTSETPIIKEAVFHGDLESTDFDYIYDAENNKEKGA